MRALDEQRERMLVLCSLPALAPGRSHPQRVHLTFDPLTLSSLALAPGPCPLPTMPNPGALPDAMEVWEAPSVNRLDLASALQAALSQSDDNVKPSPLLNPTVERVGLATDAVWLQLPDSVEAEGAAAATEEVVRRVLIAKGIDPGDIQVGAGRVQACAR